MTDKPLTWSLPFEGTHEVSASAASLSFVGGAGDLDNRGQIRNPGDLASQVKGAVENIELALTQENCSLADVVRVVKLEFQVFLHSVLAGSDFWWWHWPAPACLRL